MDIYCFFLLMCQDSVDIILIDDADGADADDERENEQEVAPKGPPRRRNKEAENVGGKATKQRKQQEMQALKVRYMRAC